MQVRWLLSLLILAICTSAVYSADDDGVTAEELKRIRAAEAARVRVVKKIRPAVVSVFGNSRRGGGSGVLFDAAGFALTNHHVVAAAGIEGWAGLDDGKLYRWKLIGTDPGGDVAIIRLSGKKKFPYAPLGLSDKVRTGDWVLAVGNPFTLAEDYKPTVTLGIVSGVKRFQKGTAQNMLVYGNCIQVDSSINPGNSGGPLFNLQGEVVGINGRASFKERGRVNVGAGYAISMKQIRNFIPDLLATKVARHGTLDAQFTNRRAGVLCSAINVDSVAAEAGLKLGDKLLKFEGESIRNANQVTNLVSTFPEGWPVELVVERDGKQQTLHIRLLPLDYGGDAKKPPVTPKKKPGKKPKTPVIKVRRPGISLANAGKIRHENVNRGIAATLLSRWRKSSGLSSPEKRERIFQLRDIVLENGKPVGSQVLTLSNSGKFRLVVDAGGKRWVFDWNRPGDRERIIANPYGLQACVLAGYLTEDGRTPMFTSTLLDAGDKAAGERAYRFQLKTGKPDDRPVYFWVSQFNAAGRDDMRLLKTGYRIDGDATRPSMTYGDWRTVEGVRLPWKRTVVVGAGEKTKLVIQTRECKSLSDWPSNDDK